MNKTLGTILVGAAVVGGALAFTGDVSSQTTVEAVDSDTIKVTEPVNIDIRILKAELDELQGQKQRLKEVYDSQVAKLQVEIDAKKVLILQAKNVGVE